MTLNYIILIIIGILTLGVTVYIFWVMGVYFFSKTKKEIVYKETECSKIAIIICAYNEEKVIGKLLESLNNIDYPKEQYQVFVVAHNCEDKTVQIALENHAEVFSLNTKEHKKALALAYGIKQIKEKYPHEFKYVAIFDADNLVDPKFLKKINNALASGYDVASGNLKAKNFCDNIVSSLCATLYECLFSLNCEPMSKLGLPVNVYGSGFAFKEELGEEFNYTNTLVEDFEFTIRLALKNKKFTYVKDAYFYAEMPVTFMAAFNQRKRWTIGQMQCYRLYRKLLRNKIFKKEIFKQYMDLINNPVWISSISCISILIVYLVLKGILIDYLWIIWFILLVYNSFTFLNALRVVYKKEVKLSQKILISALFPLWLLMSAFNAFQALFIKDLEWQDSKRESTIGIDEIKL